MLCKDKSVTYLKSFGYNVVTLPKASIQPLQIFVKKFGKLQHLGDISDVLAPKNGNTLLPPISQNAEVAHVSGKKTSKLTLGVGLSILGSIIGGLGGSKIGLNTKYENAESVTFEFSDVLEDSIKVTELDKYLNNSDIDPGSRQIHEFLESDDIYITTAVIKSDNIKVEAEKEGGGKVELDLPEIKKIIGGDIDVTAEGSQKSLITYKGNTKLVFGFKAVRLFYDDGKYSAFKFSKPGATPFSNENKDETDRYMTDSPTVGIEGL